MQDFCHLHLHTCYSLLDGACKLDELMLRVKELGQTAVALTDHGVMYAAVDFYKTAKKHGIKPIIGCEVYVAPRSRFEKQHKIDSSPFHLVLLCENETGYRNLMKLVSLGFTEGFYNKPRVDKELLRQYSKGLIALSACLAGEIPRLLMQGDYTSARDRVLEYLDIFGREHYYIELQDHNLPEQKKILPQLIRLARETGVSVVATNDTHYLRREDAEMQQVMICIQTNKTVLDDDKLEFGTDEFYLKSGNEMAQLFSYVPEAITNTVRIAERCNLDFEFGVTKLPYFKTPNDMPNLEYFKRLCWNGMKKKYGQNPPTEAIERLKYEVEMIERMGYVDYYLIVWDFVNFAKNNGIPVGPGRGSGAGSIAAYCIGITGIDPLRYDLLFERFLNPERVSMPDFDIDFCYERRQEVIDYVVQKYGSTHVAQIITFGTMAAKAAIRDTGRALGMPYAAVDKVAKAVPGGLHISLKKSLEISAALQQMYAEDPAVKRLLDMAQKLEGMPRHASTHAAGVVITKQEVSDYVPLQKSDDSIVTQFTMTTLEELGLLKIDFLGLRTLTVVRDTERQIREGKDPSFDLDQIPLDDPGVFRMLSQGKGEGVFQFESGGMKNVLASLKPEHFEDLIAVISLYRPGPMESIPQYIQNRHNPQEVVYRHPLLKPILEITYGCIVYQEQVMQICRALAGYSLGRADMVRKAMAKKKADVMEQERHNFIYGKTNDDGSVECVGAVANGVSAEIANEIFDQMTAFASYAFNKSHAAAYALLAYQTAYLKLHYRAEYMAALISSFMDNTGKIIEYISECTKNGIRVLGPDINQSVAKFAVVDGRIRFGLLAVKNVGRGFVQELVAERQRNGDFTSFTDFCERMANKEVNKRLVENLIRCGAFDSLGNNRRELILHYADIMKNATDNGRVRESGQMNLFEEYRAEAPRILPAADFTLEQKLEMEKEVTGVYVSGHPVQRYQHFLERGNFTEIWELLQEESVQNFPENSKVKILGSIERITMKNTRSGDQMAFVMLEDMSSEIEVVLFPKLFQQYRNLLKKGVILSVLGRINFREDEAASIIAEALRPAEQLKQSDTEKSSRSGVYIRFSSSDSPQIKQVQEILKEYPGEQQVFFYFEQQKQLILLPQNLRVSNEKVLIDKIRRVTGEKDVAIKE